VLLNTQDHSREGVAKEFFSSGDLLSSQFVFQPEELAKLQRRTHAE
jgi:hypothetical protein